MRRLLHDFLACLLVLVLGLAAIGAGRHGVPIALADGYCLTGDGHPAGEGEPSRHDCAQCLPALAAVLPDTMPPVAVAAFPDRAAPQARPWHRPVRAAAGPGIRAPPVAT